MIFTKKGLAAGSLSIALLTLAGCGTMNNDQAQNGSESDVQNVEGTDEETAAHDHEHEHEGEEHDHDHEHEGEEHDHEHEHAHSDEPQTVVKITDEGYATLHGDHFHQFNGKVPFDADVDDELVMNDDNYQFSEDDVVSENKDGYIIKVDGEYYLYKENK